MQVGIVKGRAISTNRDGTKQSLMLQVEITDPEDIQTIELISQDGEDTNPPDGSKVVIVSVGKAWKIAVAVNDGIAPDPTLLPGEKKIYSSDTGVIKAFIAFLKTGAMTLSGSIMSLLGSSSISLTAPFINLNGLIDTAVGYTVLKAQFDQLKADYNAHVHPPGAVPPSPTTAADITLAQKPTVRLP